MILGGYLLTGHREVSGGAKLPCPLRCADFVTGGSYICLARMSVLGAGPMVEEGLWRLTRPASSPTFMQGLAPTFAGMARRTADILEARAGTAVDVQARCISPWPPTPTPAHCVSQSV